MMVPWLTVSLSLLLSICSTSTSKLIPTVIHASASRDKRSRHGTGISSASAPVRSWQPETFWLPLTNEGTTLYAENNRICSPPISCWDSNRCKSSRSRHRIPDELRMPSVRSIPFLLAAEKLLCFESCQRSVSSFSKRQPFLFPEEIIHETPTSQVFPRGDLCHEDTIIAVFRRPKLQAWVSISRDVLH
ncbi:hypothetical protein B0T21DRAFT_57281 [Apiosordaria backusii]|uniref:Secreted protein n=1 Tax=Apiosordaria backusii TaxID=314023 RepID=A0AA40AN39_9PEZI|nr:hypothetical protein B0T21DRAFT_57281 [Apiosordaria backusii]